MKTLFIASALAVLIAAPLAAQTPRARATDVYGTPALSIRPFFVATDQNDAAKTTFNAAFGRSVEPFFGGGVQLALRNGLFVEVGVSRFRKTGQRAFINNGQTFQLVIPLTATVRPLEVSAGYRFGASRSQRIIPYVGVGVGRYSYQETSDFAGTGDNVDTNHSGYLAVGGLEFRVHRSIAVSADAQYTHVPGILGLGGVSKDAGETDLGGIAARFKVLIGR
jgi:opacity protein-like surface antigen